LQLAYRAAAYEKYSKVVAIEFSDQVRHLDKGEELPEQQWIQFQANFQKWSHGEGLKNLNLLLKSIEDIYEKRSFDQIAYSYFMTDRKLPFAGVGVFQPTMTMDGKALQRVSLVLRHELFRSSPRPESVCIAAIPMKSSTLLCLCALRHQTIAREFISSVDEGTARVVSLFLGAMMVSIENVYFTPSFLKNLGYGPMSLLKRLASLGIAEDIKESDVRMARSVTLFDDVTITEQETS
jgi:hypothetical protein